MKMKLYKLLSLTLFICCFQIANAQIYVDADAVGMNDGTSWVDAYTDLQDALANAGKGSNIWIADGTYSPGSATTDSYVLTTIGVSLYGGFNGTETMLSQRDYSNNQVILTGDVLGDDIFDDFTSNRTDNNLHVMFIPDSIINSTVLDGLYIEHGQTADGSGSGNDRRAGGILCYGSPIIRNCSFTQNYGYFAAALYPRGSTANNVVVENCTFTRNSAGYGGGAMYLVAAGMISNCIFDSNEGGRGANIFSAGDMTTISNCSFTNSGNDGTRGAAIYGSTGLTITNSTFDMMTGIWGGAIYATDTTVIDSCTFTGSSAVNNGGAILNAFDAVTTITNTEFSGNGAENGGALYTQNDDVKLSVDNCVFFGNSANGGDGGAFFSLAGPTVDFSNCLFDLNLGEFGGAIEFSSSDGKGVLDRMTLTNCEFHDNLANLQGGAINILNVDSVFLVNCLINDNTASGVGTGGGISVNASDSLNVYVSIMNSTLANNIGALASNLAAYEDTVNLGDAVIVVQNTIFHDFANSNSYAIEDGSPTVISNGGNLSSDLTLDMYFVSMNDLNLTSPSFVDELARDYSLDPSVPSACINGGVATNAPLTDINGDPRFGVPDIGAVEYPFNVSTRNIIEADESLTIYPNPVNSLLTFELDNEWAGDVQGSIVNSLGQVVANWTIAKNQNTIIEQYNVENLPTGQYILVFRFENAQAKRVMIKL